MSYGTNPPGYPPPSGGPGFDAPNPYGPPQAPLGQPGGMLSPPGGAMKWLFIAGHGGCFLFTFAGGILNAMLPASQGGGVTFGNMVAGVGALPLILVPIAAFVWLYKSWACVPPDMRYTDGGKFVSPRAAVGKMFIPFYNLYWTFVASVGLCEAINRSLVQRGAVPSAPKPLAIAACIVNLVPYCNLLVGPILWLVLMFMVDGAKRDLVNRTGAIAY